MLNAFSNRSNAGALAAALWLISSFAAHAAIPNADGTIAGCYNTKSGALRVVDNAASCARGEVPLSWSQVGPAGAQGAQGPQGPMGLTGSQGPQGPIGSQGPAGTTAFADPSRYLNRFVAAQKVATDPMTLEEYWQATTMCSTSEVGISGFPSSPSLFPASAEVINDFRKYLRLVSDTMYRGTQPGGTAPVWLYTATFALANGYQSATNQAASVLLGAHILCFRP